MNVNFSLYKQPYFTGTVNARWSKPGYKVNKQNQPAVQQVSMDKHSSSIKDIGAVRTKYLSEIVLMNDSPEELAEHIMALKRKVLEHDLRKNAPYDPKIEHARNIVRDTILHIDCKIDFRSLGVNPDKLTEDEKIEYGSKFAFWTTSFDGAKRGKFERPYYVRSAHEYIDLLEERHPLYAAEEFGDIVKRFSERERNADKRIQDAYDADYKRTLSEYQRLPFSRKLTVPMPQQKYTPIYGRLKKLEEVRQNAYDDYIANKQASQREEYERWLRDTFDNTN